MPRALRGNGLSMAQAADEEYPVGSTVPVRPFEWPWDDGEKIRMCLHCQRWCADLFLVGPDRDVWVREWHAVDCAVWSEVSDAARQD